MSLLAVITSNPDNLNCPFSSTLVKNPEVNLQVNQKLVNVWEDVWNIITNWKIDKAIQEMRLLYDSAN